MIFKITRVYKDLFLSVSYGCLEILTMFSSSLPDASGFTSLS